MALKLKTFQGHWERLSERRKAPCFGNYEDKQNSHNVPKTVISGQWDSRQKKKWPHPRPPAHGHYAHAGPLQRLATVAACTSVNGG